MKQKLSSNTAPNTLSSGYNMNNKKEIDMFNDEIGTVIDSKDIDSETYGKITVQAVFVENDDKVGEPYYEIRERYHFPHENGKETVMFSQVSMTEEGIKEIFNDYDLELAEYYAQCTIAAEEIHKIDPTAVPVL